MSNNQSPTWMMSVPKKRASSDTNIVKPLTAYIEDQACFNINDFQEALNHISKLRDDVRQSSEASVNAAQLFYRYHGVLSSLGKRVDIRSDAVNIGFAWYDAYSERTKKSDASVHYEKAAVLFNVGAIYSSLGAGEGLGSPESIKNACNYFRQAGGIFQYLREFLESYPQAAVSDDLGADSLRVLSVFMLAQAQELFYIGAKSSNMKPNITSKLAAQASDYYEQAADVTSSDRAKKIFPKVL